MAAKLLKLGWAQGLATLITFITSCPIEVTIRTRPLQIAVRQETLAFGAISLQHFVFVDVALLEQSQEHIMSNLSMVGSVSSGEQIEGDAQFPPAIEELSVVFVRYLLWGGRFLFSTNGNWRSVLVTTRNHQHIIALKAMIAGKDIGRQIGTGDVSQMQGTVGIGPGNTYENAFAQSLSIDTLL